MTMTDRYGVMALKFEFWLSVIIFVGGGLLIWQNPEYMTQIFVLWGVVLTFWFSRRQADQSTSSIMTAMQQLPLQPPKQVAGQTQSEQGSAAVVTHTQPTEEKQQ